MASFNYGVMQCPTPKCGGDVVVSVKLLATTPGGRKERKQLSTPSLRLCKRCVKDLAAGKISPAFRKSVAGMIWELGIED